MSTDDLNPAVHSKESTNVTLTSNDETQIPAHQVVLALSTPILKRKEQDDEETFSCEKCEKPIPNDKNAKILHMSRVHNENTMKNTPGPITSNKAPNPPFKC